MNIVICVIAKNENRYIKDFCNYHLNLGFDHIYIFDNNDIPEIHKIIQNNDKITVKPYKPNINNVQIELYKDFVKNYDFDWCAFIDVDEFITLNGYTNIHKYLTNFDETIGSVRLFEHVYGDDNLIYPDDMNIPVYERIKTISTKYPFYYCKEIVRKSNTYSQIHQHYFKIKNKKNVFCDNTEIQNPNQTVYKFNEIIDSYAYIRHYKTKTCLEFCEQKLGLTRISCQSDKKTKIYYFAINEYTAEKAKFIDNFLNKKV